MKNITLFILIFINTIVFAQKNDTEMFVVEEQYLISINCNKTEKNIQKECARKEFNKFLSRHLNFDFKNTPVGKHKIILSFYIDKKGQITNFKCYTKFKELEIELLRVMQIKFNALRLIIEGKGITNGFVKIPIYITVA